MSEKKKYGLTSKFPNLKKYKDHNYSLKTVIEKDSKYVIWCLKNIGWFEIDKEADEYLKEVCENQFNLAPVQIAGTM